MYRATAELADGATREYAGKFDEDRLDAQLAARCEAGNSSPDDHAAQRQADDVLYEKKRATSRGLPPAWRRWATRARGRGWPSKGATGRNASSPAAKGRFPISYKGQTYYVCCSGCKQAFNENPEKILAEYRARQEARNKSK